MKKLLSILGSLSMVATAGMAVVACGNEDNANNPSHSYSDFQSWVKDSKKGNTDIVFIGGRKDVDTLSFLAAEKAIVDDSVDKIDPLNIDTLTDSNNINQNDKKFSNMANESAAGKNDWASSIKLAFSSSDQTNKSNHLWGVDDPKSYVQYTDTLNFHSVLVDDLSSFFKNGLGKKIRTDFLKEQTKLWSDFYYSELGDGFSKNKEIKPEQKEKDIKWKSHAIGELLQSINKGPFFIILNNGNLAGITTGFNNYKEFNTKTDGAVSLNNVVQAKKDVSRLFNFIQNNVWNKLGSWIQTCWNPTTDLIIKPSEYKEPDSFTLSNTNISDWKASTNSTYNKDNAEKIEQVTFSIDPKNYID